MSKIPKNRQDAEMLGDTPEKLSFEHFTDGSDTPAAPQKPAKAEQKKSAYADFLTPELQEDLGKALLTLKLNLYKTGVVDYKVKVLCEADRIVLEPIPQSGPAKRR